jgi:hypothetical protein
VLLGRPLVLLAPKLLCGRFLLGHRRLEGSLRPGLAALGAALAHRSA